MNENTFKRDVYNLRLILLRIASYKVLTSLADIFLGSLGMDFDFCERISKLGKIFTIDDCLHNDILVYVYISFIIYKLYIN